MKNINYGPLGVVAQTSQTLPEVEIKYCLYARKSMEDEERQALSIDSQLKEMRQIAERENLFISAVRTESHSAKFSGERPVFNKVKTTGSRRWLLSWVTNVTLCHSGE